MFRPNIISDLCYVFSKATKRWIETEKLPKKLKNTAKVISWAKIKQWLTLLAYAYSESCSLVIGMSWQYAI